jgi:kynurenine formamidase
VTGQYHLRQRVVHRRTRNRQFEILAFDQPLTQVVLTVRAAAPQSAEIEGAKMSTIRFSIILVAALSLAACTAKNSNEFPKGEWIDLSHDFSEETIYWVTAEPFTRTTVAEGKTPGGYYYSAYNFSAAEHGGTHIDAPVHFGEGKKSVDQLELGQLISPAVKIDVSAKAANDRDYLITIDDIKNWESANGKLPEWSIILFQTGYGSKWPDKKSYLGTDQKGSDAVKDLHFPGLHPDAAKWLVENRKINAVGLDTASIDYGQSTTFESHVALMTNNIPAFENVANLDRLPVKGFQIVALPMKIKGGSGAPLRIVAFLPAMNP